MAEPFEIRHNVSIVSGGHLKEPWIIESKFVSDAYDNFMELMSGNRKLAIAIGLDL